MNQKIWVTGDAVVDLIPDGENHYLRCAGGAPANVAVGVARLGSPSAFIGRVGNDPLGQFMQDTLNTENVNTQHMILDPQYRTSTVVVGLDNGERSFTFMVNPSADQFLQASDLPPFQQGEWLHCCSIALINNPSREATFEAIRRIKAAGGFFSFDPNLRESLWSSLEEMKTVVMEAVALADVLKFSEEELTLLTNTDSLEKAFEKVKEGLIWKQTKLEDSMQPPLKAPFPKPDNREQFWSDFENKSFEYVAKKYGGIGFKNDAKSFMRKIKRKIKKLVVKGGKSNTSTI